MKKHLFAVLLILFLPSAALAQDGPVKLIPRYFAVENTAQYPQYVFFAITWELEPKLLIIDSADRLIGGDNTGSQTTLYYIAEDKFDEDSIRRRLDDFRAFHENKDLGQFSYPLKLNFWEVPADSAMAKTTNYLRVKDLNQLQRIGSNKEYLILEETRLVIGKTDNSEETQNLLAGGDDEKGRLPAALAILLSITLPLMLLWLVLSVYGRLRKK